MKLRNDNDGILIFDKKSGINVLLDEIKPPIYDIAPRHMSIALTNQCNFSCKHCYISHGTKNLKIEDVKKWLIELEQNGCLSVGFGGGEPTLWPHLTKLLSYTYNLEMGTTLTTNGSANISLYYEIQKYVNLIRFSFDGFGEIYESYRCQSFNFFIQKVIELSKNGKIGINYLLTDKTVRQFSELERYISLIYPEEILLIPCFDKDKHFQLSIESIDIINKWISKYNNLLPISISYTGINVISANVLPVQGLLPEEQNQYFMHINPLGELMDNVFDVNPQKIGNNLMQTIQLKRKKK